MKINIYITVLMELTIQLTPKSNDCDITIHSYLFPKLLVCVFQNYIFTIYTQNNLHLVIE